MPHCDYASGEISVILAGMGGALPDTVQLANLAALLKRSKQHPFAVQAGEILARRYGAASPGGDIDEVLAGLEARYQTPIPEAYLSERIVQAAGQRRQQGAFYTPWPLAKCLMCSAAEVVKKEFANAAPTVLDPASGAGIFFLASQPSLPFDRFHCWDSSRIAVELAHAIAEARGRLGEGNPLFEHRDALRFDPEGEAPRADSGPLLVVGNPPYSNFGKRAISPWLAGEMRTYRPPQRELKTNLRDAFLLFLRLAESLIVRRGQGAIAMVLSTTFLDAITHSAVRASLRRSFDELRILRLQSEQEPQGERLFSIRHPTAACVFVRRTGAGADRAGRVWQAELTGSRAEKLSWLEDNALSTAAWTEISASDLPVGQGRGAWNGAAAAPQWYRDGTRLSDCFREYISGVQTKNDSLFLARSRAELATKIGERFGSFDTSLVQPILVGPFDPWWIYYDPERLGRARYSVMRHMLRENVGFVFMRQATGAGEYDHFLVTRHLVTDRVFHSRWGAPFLAPLYLFEQESKRSNLSLDPPEDWLAYAYALVHSQWYRSRAGEGLRRDFPRVPPPERFSRAIREQLIGLGRQLIELHAPRSGFATFWSQDNSITPFAVSARYPKAHSVGEQVEIHANRDMPLAMVSAEIWRYRVGGVEVLPRFLMRRRRAALLAWEVAHFHEVAARIQQTIDVRRRIDTIEFDP